MEEVWGIFGHTKVLASNAQTGFAGGKPQKLRTQCDSGRETTPRGKAPSPGGNLPSDRYLTRYPYSCSVGVRMVRSVNGMTPTASILIIFFKIARGI